MTNPLITSPPITDHSSLLARLDRLGDWAATALRCARQSEREHIPHLVSLFRANAGCYNECAGLLASDLGLAEFCGVRFEVGARVSSPAAMSELDASRAFVPPHISDFLSSFQSGPLITAH